MAAIQKLLSRVAGTLGLTEITAVTAGGSSNAGKVPALDGTNGLLDISMMPAGVGADVDSSGVCDTTALTAGMFVNFFNAAGTKKVRPADNTDNTKPAHGFVLAGFTSTQAVTVYLPGAINNLIPLASYVAADIGKPLYLATAGSTTLTRPATTGNLDQPLGFVDNVGAAVSCAFAPELPITVA